MSAVSPAPLFDQLQAELTSGGIESVLASLAQQLRDQREYHLLFEALKMQVRHRCGLPVLYQEVGDELEEAQRDQLEEGLLGACREVGQLLWKEGKVREGWMYLRPVGGTRQVVQQLSEIPLNDDNLEEIIEVSLHEGLDTVRGFALVLEHYGTCNAITTYESSLARQGGAGAQAAAGMLVEHVHRELTASVRADIEQREGQPPQEPSLHELIADRDWLFGEHSYHIDTTHLASTVRCARSLEEPAVLRLAKDLTEYGRRLHRQFQYRGEEPFVDIYPTHALYFAALLGEDVEAAVDFFRQRAESVDIDQYGAGAVEAYVQLLDHLGRHGEAMEALMQLAARGAIPAPQIVPTLVTLAEQAGDYASLAAFCREQQDLVGFATAIIRAHQQPPARDH